MLQRSKNRVVNVIGNGMLRAAFGACVLLVGLTWGYAQITPSDPGLRGGPGAGQPFATGLTGGELASFDNGLMEFIQTEDVPAGLGPRFNFDSCGGCHIQPAFGGSSPPPSSGNPQVLQAARMAPYSTIPSFLSVNGPIREVRFVRSPTGALDGGVKAIFTITGRPDAPSTCAITQPDFSYGPNMIFRIPTPVFGAGLIETITDTTLKNNLMSDPGGMKARFGIRGHLNTNGNDGTVTRFGWKAQNKSLLLFSGEAYNVEMGVTNELFQNEREEDPNCATNGLAENHTDFDTGDSADIVGFMTFMRFLDQPTPACGVVGQPACSASVNNGRYLFTSTGCATCHTPSLTTGLSPVDALNQKQVKLYSDLALHHMGTTLADNVAQGNAAGDEFRTAPLWGVGQRAFFMHDGRTSDLLQAILAHSSSGSEAVNVITAFQALTASQKQDILNFLRSL